MKTMGIKRRHSTLCGVGLGALIFACGLSALGAEAGTDRCVDLATAEKAIDGLSFESVDSTVELKRCEKDNKRSFDVLNGLALLQNLPRLSEQTSEFRPGFLETDAMGFFKKRIRTIVFEGKKGWGCDESDTSSVLAFVYGFEASQHVMHVCPAASEGGMDAFELAAVLLHEARHIDGFPHADCEAGSLKGEAACDPSYEYGGSYSIGAEFSVLMAQEPSVNPAVRMRARAQAVSDFLQRFNKKPLGLKEGVLLQEPSGQVSFFDGRVEVPMGYRVEQGQVLGSRWGTPVFYDMTSGTVLSYSYAPELVPAAGTMAKRFAESLNSSQRQGLLDVIYFGAHACMLFTDHIICDGDNGYVEKSFTGLRALRFIASEKSTLVESDQVYVVAEDGALYQLPKNYNEYSASEPAQWKRIEKTYDMIGLAPWTKGKELLLGRDGVLATFSKKGETPQPLPATEGRVFEKLIGPYFWSKKLEAL